MASDYLSDTFGLKDQVAVVIGGNGSLGGAAACALGKAGASVLIVGRNEETCRSRVKELRDAGIAAEFYTADATSAADMERVLAHVLHHEHFERVQSDQLRDR